MISIMVSEFVYSSLILLTWFPYTGSRRQGRHTGWYIMIIHRHPPENERQLNKAPFTVFFSNNVTLGRIRRLRRAIENMFHEITSLFHLIPMTFYSTSYCPLVGSWFVELECQLPTEVEEGNRRQFIKMTSLGLLLLVKTVHCFRIELFMFRCVSCSVK